VTPRPGSPRSGALEEARVVFERAVCLDEAAVGARLGLARLCLELGERDAAISHAERATLSAPSDDVFVARAAPRAVR
jgi:tetratricopeptide (TPR) repeat protein